MKFLELLFIPLIPYCLLVCFCFFKIIDDANEDGGQQEKSPNSLESKRK